MKRFLSSPKVTRNVSRMEIRAQQQEVSLRELGRRERGNLCLGEQPAVVMGISLQGTGLGERPDLEEPTILPSPPQGPLPAGNIRKSISCLFFWLYG